MSEIFAADLLAGQAALVTGGGTGLGRAAAAELVACGAEVVICGRREQVLKDACEAIGDRCSWLAGDIRQVADAERLIDVLLERHGRLDTLVNNAGGQYFVPAESITAKGWQAVMGLNVGGTATMARTAVDRAMRPAGGGMIVNVTLSPHHGLPAMTHSSAARAAVEAMTHAWAREWAPDGIAVTAAAAGHFETEALDKYPAVVRAGAARSVPLQRLGTVQEHAWLIALLASPLGRALNGTVITLDGARDNWFGPWPPPTLTDESGEVPTEERRSRE
ncbi:MAG TPA: SDR family oxidoreductase [Solirubrobacteraceae bacterium]|nr:SDR family oxidoreductase [Solirubrobacteraceae bacterium]